MKRSIWIPVVFPAAYFLGAWCVGYYYGSSGTWPGMARAIGIEVMVILVAIPSTILLWLTWAWWTSRRPVRPLGRLIVLSCAMPFIVTAVVNVSDLAVRANEKTRTARQLSHAQLTDLKDELLRSPSGNPIGVRLRYKMRFEKGLADPRYRPRAEVVFETTPAIRWQVRRIVFSQLQSSIEPNVEGEASFGKGEYRFAEDFVPAYFPRFFWFPEQPQPERADDRCFLWRNAAQRETAEAREEAPRFLAVRIQPFGFEGRSAQAYSLKAFYDGAVKEGARDCLSESR